MSDLIDRDKLIDFIMESDPEWCIKPIRPIFDYIKEMPSAQPTLYGYKIEHLVLIARVMEKEGVSPEEAVKTFQNIVEIVQMIADEQKEIIRKAVEQWT